MRQTQRLKLTRTNSMPSFNPMSCFGFDLNGPDSDLETSNDNDAMKFTKANLRTFNKEYLRLQEETKKLQMTLVKLMGLFLADIKEKNILGAKSDVEALMYTQIELRPTREACENLKIFMNYMKDQKALLKNQDKIQLSSAFLNCLVALNRLELTQKFVSKFAYEFDELHLNNFIQLKVFLEQEKKNHPPISETERVNHNEKVAKEFLESFLPEDMVDLATKEESMGLLKTGLKQGKPRSPGEIKRILNKMYVF